VTLYARLSRDRRGILCTCTQKLGLVLRDEKPHFDVPVLAPGYELTVDIYRMTARARQRSPDRRKDASRRSRSPLIREGGAPPWRQDHLGDLGTEPRIPSQIACEACGQRQLLDPERLEVAARPGGMARPWTDWGGK
jgi:hypothetical protein